MSRVLDDHGKRPLGCPLLEVELSIRNSRSELFRFDEKANVPVGVVIDDVALVSEAHFDISIRFQEGVECIHVDRTPERGKLGRFDIRFGGHQLDDAVGCPLAPALALENRPRVGRRDDRQRRRPA